MIKEAIGTASSREEAMAEALRQLNPPEDVDVQYEVLEMPSKKVLGLFGGSPAKVRAYYEESESRFADAEAYITAILKGMGIPEVTVETSVQDEEDVVMQINCGDDYGFIIGRRGETLDALQYLVRLVLNKDKNGFKRVSLNVGNYREKREQTLRELAAKSAEKVKKYGRSFALDPMNPYERRVIHTTVQEIEGVDSHSVGSENERRVVITPTDAYRKTGDFKGGSDRREGGSRGGADRREGGSRSGGDRRDNGRSGGNYRDRNSRPRQQAPAAPSRPPRSDAQSTSRYEKIIPPAKKDAE